MPFQQKNLSRRSIRFPAAVSLVLLSGLLFAGLLPLSMPLGVAVGGVIETGQVALGRWWLGAAGALLLYMLLSLRWEVRTRLYWGAVLLAGGLAMAALFVTIASRGQPRAASEGGALPGVRRPVGVISALPLFWREDALNEGMAGGHPAGPGMPDFTHMPLRAIDHADAKTLSGIGTVLLAQPRLLQPEELVAIDDWVRAGGQAVILADPLLVWPSALPPGDPRRAPLTSLLDPLLKHWGLRLEPAASGGAGIERRMLTTGHVLMLAGASRFTLLPQREASASCVVAERGLMAVCRVGRGSARLVADSDMLDDRLWLVDRRFRSRPEAQASDIVALMDGWLRSPINPPLRPPPARIVDEPALIAAVRWSLIFALAWVGLGGAGQRLLLARKVDRNLGENPEKNRLHP